MFARLSIAAIRRPLFTIAPSIAAPSRSLHQIKCATFQKAPSKVKGATLPCTTDMVMRSTPRRGLAYGKESRFGKKRTQVLEEGACENGFSRSRFMFGSRLRMAVAIFVSSLMVSVSL